MPCIGAGDQFFVVIFLNCGGLLDLGHVTSEELFRVSGDGCSLCDGGSDRAGLGTGGASAATVAGISAVNTVVREAAG